MTSIQPSTLPAAPVRAGRGAESPANPAQERKIKDAARQFEALFMTEMLSHARPSGKAVGAFAPGHAEETWRGMMDQALGQAAATGGPAGDNQLRRSIEQSLRDADTFARRGGAR